MSVAALSPFSGSKRLLESAAGDTDSPCDRSAVKRGRFVGSPGRCSGPPPAFGAVHPGTLNALKALFPGMDDQVRRGAGQGQGGAAALAHARNDARLAPGPQQRRRARLC